MAGEAADSANSRSSCGSTFWNDGCGGGTFGTAMSSVSSNTSGSGSGSSSGSSCGARIPSGEVASSSPFNRASISSWLLGALAAGAGGEGAGGGTGAAGFFSDAATAAGIFEGGMSAIAGFGAGAAAAGFSGFAGAGVGAAAAAGAAGLLSPAGGFASSSAMIRRIDARISSIEGSWTFAGCVISDSKSSTPSHALSYTKHDGICRFRLHGLARFYLASLTCPQIKRGTNHRAAPPLLRASKRRGRVPHERHESLCCLRKGYVMAINVCKQRPVERLGINPNLCCSQRNNHNRTNRIKTGRDAPRSASTNSFTKSATVGRANAEPAVANLLVVHARIVGLRGQVEHLRRQAPDRIQDRVGSNDAVVLRGHKRDACVDQRLLGVQHVERGTLTSLRFFAHAVERDFR